MFLEYDVQFIIMINKIKSITTATRHCQLPASKCVLIIDSNLDWQLFCPVSCQLIWKTVADFIVVFYPTSGLSLFY